MITFKSLLSCWDKFFFEEKPTEGISLFRILWFSVLLLYFLIDIPMIDKFYGPYAVISQETTQLHSTQNQINLFNLFPPGKNVTYSLFVLYGVSIIFSLLGLYTKTSMTFAFVLMTSFHQRNPWMLSASEVLMRLITFYLIFSPCAQKFSVDALIARKNGLKLRENWPVWSLRLIQIQVSVVYLWTLWHKLKGETWVDGTAIYYATRIENLKLFSVPFVLDSLPMIKALTWGTLLMEFGLGAMIWFSEFRKPLIAIGVIFHIGMHFVLSIPFFGISMILLLINFYTPEELKAFVDRIWIFIYQLKNSQKLSPAKI